MIRPSYVVITPVRDEVKYVHRTIESMAAQSIRAAEWIIVDDGSTDGTSRILEEAASRYEWITVVQRPDRGKRVSGGGVVEAFNEGYSRLSGQSWDFLVKLDGDLSFDKEYFSECFRKFAEDPRLGVGGGAVYVGDGSELQVESPGDPPFHVRGATKIYSRECWQEISPLVIAPGWDTIDEVKANMKGWRTRTFPDLRVVQHKPTGTADGTWLNAFKNGRANYVTGYDPLFMLAKCFKRAFTSPPLVCAVAMTAGFCSGYLKRLPQVQDAGAIHYLRQQQRRRLLLRRSIYS